MNPRVATIGFFDGVHTGHRFVIGCVADEARRRGWQSVVITFDRHPREVLSEGTNATADTCRRPLTTLEERRQLIAAAGADRCEVLPFDTAMATMTARDFMQEVLLGRLGVRALLLGHDNRFGHRADNDECFDDYAAYGRQLGIDVRRLPAHGKVSSTAIRRALQEGQVAEAAQLLGRSYAVEGHVVHGYAIGRDLGFPTANIAADSFPTMIPASGVYAVRAIADGDGQHLHDGMMNIGVRPTFGGGQIALEVHLLDYSGNLYDRRLRIEFIERIRQESHFDSPEALQRQLAADALQARSILSRHPADGSRQDTKEQKTSTV